jgi:hypothetical protein
MFLDNVQQLQRHATWSLLTRFPFLHSRFTGIKVTSKYRLLTNASKARKSRKLSGRLLHRTCLSEIRCRLILDFCQNQPQPSSAKSWIAGC